MSHNNCEFNYLIYINKYGVHKNYIIIYEIYVIRVYIL